MLLRDVATNRIPLSLSLFDLEREFKMAAGSPGEAFWLVYTDSLSLGWHHALTIFFFGGGLGFYRKKKSLSLSCKKNSFKCFVMMSARDESIWQCWIDAYRAFGMLMMAWLCRDSIAWCDESSSDLSCRMQTFTEKNFPHPRSDSSSHHQ